MWDRPQLLNWIANLLYAIAIVLMLYGTLYVVVHLPIFPLREINVEGQLTHVTREQLKLISSKHLNGNFFTLDLVEARSAFQKLPWARNVSVRRHWPDRLDIVVEEHQAMARWGNIALVNTYGELFQAASDKDLPVFYGPGDGVKEVTEHYAQYSKILSQADILIAELALSQRRAWQIKTNKGMTIELGHEQTEARLQKFVSVYDKTIATVNAQLAYADLRYPNGFAVRKPKGGTAKLEATKADSTKVSLPKLGSPKADSPKTDFKDKPQKAKPLIEKPIGEKPAAEKSPAVKPTVEKEQA